MSIRPLITSVKMLTSAEPKKRGPKEKPEHLRKTKTLAFRVTADVADAVERHRVNCRFSEPSDAARDLIIWALEKKNLLK